MKSSIRSTTAGLLALTLGALCLADSPKPSGSSKTPAGAAKGTWKSSVGTTTAVEGAPAADIATLPDLVVVPVEGSGGGHYLGFKVSNAGKSSTKFNTTLSFQCWKQPKPGDFYEPAPCPVASAVIGPLAPRASSQEVKIWVDSPLPGSTPLKHSWKFAARVDEQNAIPEKNETNNIAQWDYVPSPFSAL